jgi:hypothetical protein
MIESPTITEKTKSTASDKIATIDLASMEGGHNGYSTSVDGERTGGVLVKKDAAQELGGSYVHEAEALAALAPDSTPEDLEAIRASMSESARLTVDAHPNGKGPNDRVIGVYVGSEKIGGGGKFVGSKELVLPNGEYVNEAALKAAIAALRKASSPAELEKGDQPKGRLFKALAAAAVLLSLLVPSASASQFDAPEKGSATASAPLHPEVVDEVPAQEEEEVPPAPEVEANWSITDGMGGEELFKQVGIDPAKWYDIQETLIAQYPGYFYRSESGDVRFDHAGEVPTEIQQTIESLT